jgi:aspartate/methionine/tyrosine aminotransferase
LKPAARLDGLGFSLIRKMNLGAPPDAISLGLGEPTWPLAAAASRALATSGSDCSYGPNAGIPELVEAVATFYGVNPDRVMLTAGSQGALFAVFQACAEPGFEVLVPDPGFLAYPVLARLSGALPVPYPLGPGGSLDADAFLAVLASHPRATLAIINHPGNPSGGGVTAADLARVAEACRNADAQLVSDEVYRELYLGECPPSLLEVSDYGLVLSSVSKAWGAPGLRVGWAIGDPAVLAPARLVHNFMTTAAARPSQMAALALIADSAVVIPAARSALRLRWKALEAALSSYLGIHATPPAGAFYYWLSLPREAHADPVAFCLRVRDEGRVIVVPGLAFGERGRAYARVSYAGIPEDLGEGIKRLAPYFVCH